MYEMIAQLQQKGLSEGVIRLVEDHELSKAREVFDNLMGMTDGEVAALNKYWGAINRGLSPSSR